MSHSLCLPNYSVGEDCYQRIGYYARHCGKKAAVIGGKTAMEKARDALLQGIDGSGIEILDFIWYGGDCTYENGQALMDNEAVRQADTLFGVGGGRACDLCKYVATKLDKPLFLFPTVASNCASVTAISVMYHPDGTFREDYYPNLPEHTFIHTGIIADSPYALLWAGIGDALSKECEAVFASKGATLKFEPLMGVQLSKVCTEPLLMYGAQALAACREKRVTPELEQVVLDIIVATGLVSNMTTRIPEYYYNSSLAHCVYNGATATQFGGRHLHGEIVALGVLCLLTYDGQLEQRNRIMAFNHQIGLPSALTSWTLTRASLKQLPKERRQAQNGNSAPRILQKRVLFSACGSKTRPEGLSSLPCSAAVNPLAPCHTNQYTRQPFESCRVYFCVQNGAPRLPVTAFQTRWRAGRKWGTGTHREAFRPRGYSRTPCSASRPLSSAAAADSWPLWAA